LFTASVRAPLTGIVLMVELTGKYDFMLPLLASCLVAYGIAEWMRDTPIYEALRERAKLLPVERTEQLKTPAPPTSPEIAE
jgi:chloride channel protein, CIC family